ncbi:MAG: ABC transporter ATP-binding protein, partial [Desulfurivibrionaceae bacterium]|nr:ABC transporter ATP-binding protein [Desulfurivibrionaceae bacterium]
MNTSTSDKVIIIESLTKAFGAFKAVDRVNLEIGAGEIFGFLGPNGAGKTTTINILLGLVRMTSGHIDLLGLAIPKNHKQVKRYIGVVPQTDSLDSDLTVAENLLTYASYFAIPRKKALAKTEELLHFFALHNRCDEIIEHL